MIDLIIMINLIVIDKNINIIGLIPLFCDIDFDTY